MKGKHPTVDSAYGREMIETCLNCKAPPGACDTGRNREFWGQCEYYKKYRSKTKRTIQPAPVLMQHYQGRRADG